MKLRKGDLVVVGGSAKDVLIGIVLGTEKDWYCIKDHIDVLFVGDNLGTITPLDRIISFIRREEIKNWWDFI